LLPGWPRDLINRAKRLLDSREQTSSVFEIQPRQERRL